MKHKIQKTDTPHTPHPSTTNWKRQNKWSVNKENHDWKEDDIIFPQERRLEKSQGRYPKGKQIITKYPNEQHH